MSECTKASRLLGKAHRAYLGLSFPFPIFFCSCRSFCWHTIHRPSRVASMQAPPVLMFFSCISASCFGPLQLRQRVHSQSPFGRFRLALMGRGTGVCWRTSFPGLFHDTTKPPTFNVYFSLLGFFLSFTAGAALALIWLLLVFLLFHCNILLHRGKLVVESLEGWWGLVSSATRRRRSRR